MDPLQNIKLSFKCPKQLNELQPCNGDWYCGGCQKIVYDLRGMEEGQVLDAFAESNYQMCGLFEKGRIDVSPKQSNWFRWASAALLALVTTVLQSCENRFFPYAAVHFAKRKKANGYHGHHNGGTKSVDGCRRCLFSSLSE